MRVGSDQKQDPCSDTVVQGEGIMPSYYLLTPNQSVAISFKRKTAEWGPRMRTIRLLDWARTKRLVTAWTLLLGGGVIALAACDHAYAEPPALSPEFRAILWHPQHRGAVVQAAQQSVAWINNPCPSATFTPVEPITIYRAAEFDAQAKPTAGEWKESVTASGCGGERMLNVLSTVPSPGALVSSVLLGGSQRGRPRVRA